MTSDAGKPKDMLLPYVTRLLDNHPAEFLSFYSSTDNRGPAILPQSTHQPRADEPDQQIGPTNPELCEGLDLEARRAKDIIQRGLSILPPRSRPREAATQEDTNTADI